MFGTTCLEQGSWTLRTEKSIPIQMKFSGSTSSCTFTFEQSFTQAVGQFE